MVSFVSCTPRKNKSRTKICFLNGRGLNDHDLYQYAHCCETLGGSRFHASISVSYHSFLSILTHGEFGCTKIRSRGNSLTLASFFSFFFFPSQQGQCCSPLLRSGGWTLCCCWWTLLVNPPSSVATASRWTRITRYVKSVKWILSFSYFFPSLKLISENDRPFNTATAPAAAAFTGHTNTRCFISDTTFDLFSSYQYFYLIASFLNLSNCFYLLSVRWSTPTV